MLALNPQAKIYLACESIDFRRGIDGFAAYCRDKWLEDPFSGHYFIFRSRKKTALKILYYDTTGFCLFHKRLSKGTFRCWPSSSGDRVIFPPNLLHQLLHGLSF